MGIRTLVGNNEGDSQGAVLYDSVSGWSIGPVWEDEAEAEAFLETVGMDLRLMSQSDIEHAVEVFRASKVDG